MIKLEKGVAPSQLSKEFVTRETERYKHTQESVWNLDWLKSALLELSHYKCAYCEGKLDIKSEYMEVEHFRDKKDYPNDVLLWENLLPACKHCNCHKSSHDVVAEPILNPFNDLPHEHLFLKSFMYKSKDLLGKTTIEVLDLNECPRLVVARCQIGTEINKLLEERLEEIESGLTKQGAKTRFKNKIRNLLKKCLPESEYSAVCSTELVKSLEFEKIIAEMKAQGLWDDELNEYTSIINAIALT